MAQFVAVIPTIPGQPAPVYSYPAATIIFNSLVGIAINIYVLMGAPSPPHRLHSPPRLPQQS